MEVPEGAADDEMGDFTLAQLTAALSGAAEPEPPPPPLAHASGGSGGAARAPAAPVRPRLPGEAALASPGVLAACAAHDLGAFAELLRASGFDAAIERMARTAAWGVTVFAPLSAPLLAALAAHGAEGAPLGEAALREILRAHVATGVLTASQLESMGAVQTDAGQCHAVHAGAAADALAPRDAGAGAGGAARALSIAGVRLLVADIPICHGAGVLHVLARPLPALRLTLPPRREQVWNKIVRPQPRLALFGAVCAERDVLRAELRRDDTDKQLERALRGHQIALAERPRGAGGGRAGAPFSGGVAAFSDLVIVEKPPELPKKKRGRADGSGGGSGAAMRGCARYRLVYALLRRPASAAGSGAAGGPRAPPPSACEAEGADGRAAADGGGGGGGPAADVDGLDGVLLSMLDAGGETVLRNSFHVLSEPEKALRRAEYKLAAPGQQPPAAAAPTRAPVEAAHAAGEAAHAAHAARAHAVAARAPSEAAAVGAAAGGGGGGGCGGCGACGPLGLPVPRASAPLPSPLGAPPATAPSLLDLSARACEFGRETRVWVHGGGLCAHTAVYFGHEQALAVECVSPSLCKATAPPQWAALARLPAAQPSVAVAVRASNDGGASFSNALSLVYARGAAAGAAQPPPPPPLPQQLGDAGTGARGLDGGGGGVSALRLKFESAAASFGAGAGVEGGKGTPAATPLSPTAARKSARQRLLQPAAAAAPPAHGEAAAGARWPLAPPPLALAPPPALVALARALRGAARGGAAPADFAAPASQPEPPRAPSVALQLTAAQAAHLLALVERELAHGPWPPPPAAAAPADPHGPPPPRLCDSSSIAQQRVRSAARLQSFIANRPSVPELRAANVLRGDDDEPTAVDAVAETLAAFLGSRPSVPELLQANPNVLMQTAAAPALQPAQLALARSMVRDALDAKLKSRPSPSELGGRGVALGAWPSATPLDAAAAAAVEAARRARGAAAGGAAAWPRDGAFAACGHWRGDDAPDDDEAARTSSRARALVPPRSDGAARGGAPFHALALAHAHAHGGRMSTASVDALGRAISDIPMLDADFGDGAGWGAAGGPAGVGPARPGAPAARAAAARPARAPALPARALAPPSENSAAAAAVEAFLSAEALAFEQQLLCGLGMATPGPGRGAAPPHRPAPLGVLGGVLSDLELDRLLNTQGLGQAPGGGGGGGGGFGLAGARSPGRGLAAGLADGGRPEHAAQSPTGSCAPAPPASPFSLALCAAAFASDVEMASP